MSFMPQFVNDSVPMDDYVICIYSMCIASLCISSQSDNLKEKCLWLEMDRCGLSLASNLKIKPFIKQDYVTFAKKWQ